jgi:hypothetical protein
LACLSGTIQSSAAGTVTRRATLVHRSLLAQQQIVELAKR